MFGRKRQKPAEVRPEFGTSSEPAIAALLIDLDTFSFARLRKQLTNVKIAGRTPSEVSLNQDDILSFHLGDEFFALALMPAPYPWSDLEGPCATAWMWPKETAAVELKRHRTHLLVTMMGGTSNPVQRRLMLTIVTAMAAKQPGVIAVYWPESTMVHYPPIFIEMAESIAGKGGPPLYLWVDFRIFQNPDKTTGLFTTGMKALGHMEIEIPAIRMSPGDLRDWTINIAGYLLEKGPILEDGNSIGMTAEQKIRIRHVASMFDRPGLVLRMEP